MKPVSFNEDAEEWGEEAVENLRHESNTPRIMWGHRRKRRQAFGIIRSMGSSKEIMSDRFHHRDIEKGSQRERWRVSAERHLLLWTCETWIHGALGMTHPKEFQKAGPPMPFSQFTLISALVGLGSARSTK